MGGKGGRALGEDDAELATVPTEEADENGGPPRPEQLGAGGGGRSRFGVVGGGGRPVEPQALDERVHVRGGAGALPRHGRDREELVNVAEAPPRPFRSHGLRVFDGYILPRLN